MLGALAALPFAAPEVSVSHNAARPVAPDDAKAEPVRVYIHAARPADDFTPVDLKNRQDSARDVTKHLKRLSGFGTRLRSVLSSGRKGR